jgi:putative ABC transport system permease protein
VLMLMLSQMRRGAARVLTMLFGILVATSSFTVLSGAVETSQLEVSGSVDEHYRAAYDILVRPPQSRTPLETDAGLVRPNFLAGQFGGITSEQLDVIAAMSEVDVAAPIGMVGYVEVRASIQFDLTEYVDRSLDRQLLRVRHQWQGDRGLSSIEDPGFHYIYVTRNKVLWPDYVQVEGSHWRFEGYHLSGEKVDVDRSVCEGEPFLPPPVEVLPDGSLTPICNLPGEPTGQTELTAAERTRLEVKHLRPDGAIEGYEGLLLQLPGWDPLVGHQLTIQIEWPMMLLVAAIDPEREVDLVGLDTAISSGRYLASGDSPQLRGSLESEDEDFDPRLEIPVLASSTAQIDEQLWPVVEYIESPPSLAGVSFNDLLAQFGEQPAVELGRHLLDAEDAYHCLVRLASSRGRSRRCPRTASPRSRAPWRRRPSIRPSATFASPIPPTWPRP